MKKLVNVYTRGIIRTVKGVPIRSTVKSIKLDVDDIRACILAKAKVEEVLANGKVITLTLANYYKDNTETATQQPAPKQTVEAPKKDTPVVKEVKKEEPVVEKVIETPVEVVPEEVPDVEETVVTEETVTEDVAVEEPATIEEVVEEAVVTEEAPKKTYGKKNR